MKKLVLLAVVLIGITATSFAQQTLQAQAGIQAQVQAATSPNASFWIGSLNDMDLGIITNKAEAGHNATLQLLPNGNATPNAYLTYTGIPKPASFLVKGSGTTLDNTQITVTPSIPVFSGGHGVFESNNTTYVSVTPVAGQSGQYTIKVGGLLTLDKDAIGTISVSGLTVTVNGH